MHVTHFIAMLPLIIFLILEMIWYGRGLLHIMTLAYNLILAFIAITQGWEFFFLPVCVGIGIISLILFAISMSKGDWL